MTEVFGEPEPSGQEARRVTLEANPPRPVDILLAVLQSDYAILLDRLSERLGSFEAGTEALHETYVKLRSEPAIVEVKWPRAYLYRMAINLTANRRRKLDRLMVVDSSTLSTVPDGSPDPEGMAIAADELNNALLALRTLPARSREIFFARWRDDKSLEAIAAEFGLHKRSVQKELVRAEKVIRRRLGKPKSHRR